eukprot:gene12237-12375_t
MQFDQFYWAEKVADLGCSTTPLALDKLLPKAGAGSCGQGADILSASQQQQVQLPIECNYPKTVTAETEKVQAAAAYLAGRVQAAVQHSVLESCRQLKESIAGEAAGLEIAAQLVLRYW